MRIAYEEWNPRGKSLELVEKANQICAKFKAAGYNLTVRQLYYQFVSEDILPNNMRSYKNLINIIDRARKAGLLSWSYIEDRTRNLRGFNTYGEPGDLVADNADSFHVDLWQDQSTRVEVWVEKEALADVVGRAALSRGVDFFSCRGYVSQSEMHDAALRHRRYMENGQDVTIIHLGDHDPSGIDMTRDIWSRLELFLAGTNVNRIALNMDQINEFKPPPNPAKMSDSRADGYVDKYGRSSWELDALDPDVITKLITGQIDSIMSDADAFAERRREEAEGVELLQAVADNWGKVSDFTRELM